MTHQEFIDTHLVHHTSIKYEIKNGTLYVYNSISYLAPEFVNLPNNLYIDGWLNLSGAAIKILSNNLYITNCLLLYKTEVKYIPDTFFIGGQLFNDRQLQMSEVKQLDIISKHNENILVIKNPTKKAISLQKLLWEI